MVKADLSGKQNNLPCLLYVVIANLAPKPLLTFLSCITPLPFQEHYTTFAETNQGEALYIIRNLLRYIIKTKFCISSSRQKYTPKGVMRYNTAMPC